MPPSSLRILADENIPLVREAFGTLGSVTLLPGRRITPEAARNADILLVRSVTPVDAALVAGSPVRFVGSATIGTDHIDHEALRAQHIAFANAPGSNAESVVEYVLAALLRLAARHRVGLRGKTVGVVGCGNIGGRLAERLAAFGLRVLKNDPPLAAQGDTAQDFVPFDALLAEADIVTVHIPLIRTGPHATHHLFDKTTLNRLKPGAWLLNTARGAVVDNEALKAGADRLGAIVLDVWENEPTPDPALLRRVDFGTPHIAGHSYDGKVQGTLMLYRALIKYLNQPARWDEATVLAPGPDDRLALAVPDGAHSEVMWLDALARHLYDLSADDARLRGLLNRPREEHAAFFSGLRTTYPRRRTFRLHTLARHAVPEAYRMAVEAGLGVRLREE